MVFHVKLISLNFNNYIVLIIKCQIHVVYVELLKIVDLI